MSDDFGPELQAAHNEEMTKLVGRYIALAIFVIGLSGVTCVFVMKTAEDPCTLCLETVGEGYGAVSAHALGQCVKLCPEGSP